MRLTQYLAIALLLLVNAPAEAQTPQLQPAGTLPARQEHDSFIPVSKYLARGDAESLSAWFSDNLEISVLGESCDASKIQARQIMKAFFEAYTPRSCEVLHTAGRATMKYALAALTAGGETFKVTIFANCKKGSYKIQQLSVERF